MALSTLGTPDLSLAEAARLAAGAGCAGLEIRVHGEVHVGMDHRAARQALARAGVEAACLAGYAKVCAPGEDEPVVEELRALIGLASRLGAPGVRVFPGGDAPAGPRIAAVLPELRAAGVRLLVETHDTHPTGAAAVRLVESFEEPDRVAVLWDALHPWRHGESPAQTRAALGPYLAYFQVKDAVGVTDTTPVPPGEGAVPLDECAAALGDWTGWVSLEWERPWYPGLGPVDAALRAAVGWFQQYAHRSSA
ncbi:sugar phosphate isomerase/epimerase family protein [Saccharothrix variisporea]|uniref:Sugar phosphate isomerase/epimerase n=1 Tax=Saccharothrix variisporea TaxID=543527 RepID=A0A495XK30_9PSEU|nr:sugar phosphate isomerase/epimerase family protein [Saccharothrix variisporea]RKT74252.1 sugar phosphate isomerase/epimerase [Saccharothrix variisporea]